MLILDNPEFIRLCRIKLRARTMIVLGVASTAVFGSILALMQYNMKDQVALYQSFFFTVVTIQLGAGSLYALMLSSQNITLERERNTYDFQRLVAMGPWRLGLGKLFGASIEAQFGILGGTLFAFVPVMMGAIPAWGWLESQLVVFVFLLMVTSFGLMCSSMVAKTSYSSGLMILFVLFVMPMAVGRMGSSSSSIWSAANPALIIYQIFYSVSKFGPAVRSMGGVAGLSSVSLFGIDGLPLIGGFLLTNLAFTTLFFVVMVRRLTDEELSMIRPRHAVVAFAILELLLIGSGWDEVSQTSRGPLHMLAAFHTVNAVVMMLLAFGLTPSAELVRGRISRGRRDQHWSIFFERSNRLQDGPSVCAVGIFGLAYAVLALVLTVKLAAMYPAIWNFPAFAIIAMVVAMGIATAALLLYINVYTDHGGLKLGALIVVLSLTVPPLIVAKAVGPEKVFAINPFAYIWAFSENAELQNIGMGYGEISQFACPALCILLAILLSALAAMRLRFLLDMDEIQRQRDQERAAKPSDKAVAAARAMLASPGPLPEMPAEIEAKAE